MGFRGGCRISGLFFNLTGVQRTEQPGVRSPTATAVLIVKPITPIATLLLVTSSPSGTGAQEPVSIPDDPSCTGCEIRLERVATVGLDGPLLSRLRSLAMDSDGWFYVGSTYEPGVIAVYDPTGRHVRNIGREGEGPGEFRGLARPFVGPEDTVHVFEHVRHTVLAPRAEEFVRLRTLPLPPNWVAFTPDGTLLIQHALLIWTLEGQRLRTYRREAAWFPDWSRKRTTQITTENPMLSDIFQDGEGRVWTVIRVPDPAREPWGVRPGDLSCPNK